MPLARTRWASKLPGPFRAVQRTDHPDRRGSRRNNPAIGARPGQECRFGPGSDVEGIVSSVSLVRWLRQDALALVSAVLIVLSLLFIAGQAISGDGDVLLYVGPTLSMTGMSLGLLGRYLAHRQRE